MIVELSKSPGVESQDEPITLCAPAIRGESLVSQVGRYHVLSGNRTTRETYNDLFQRAPFSLTFVVPPYLGGLTRMLPGGDVQSLHSLVQEATLLPLFQIYTCASFGTEGAHAGLNEALQQLPKRMVDSFGWTRLCPTCLHEDDATFGVSMIRTAHQIPGVSHCFRHGVPLMDRCPGCRCPFERKNDLVLFPWSGCAACRKHWKSMPSEPVGPADNKIALGFAQFTAQLLQGRPKKQISSDSLATLYREGLRG
ncbi:TniQ family protein, partial [Caballeronia sp. LjRoot29]|uniref:TniQ family protein n=1 Tax=Caballeronia sp. LjRoot29 TaxID=3342315 RepID=UPI003F4F880D